MKRDEFKCKSCGDDEAQLSVHHKKYVYGKDVWDYPDSNFITVCMECHDKITISKKMVKELIDDNFVDDEELCGLLCILKELKGETPYVLQQVCKSIPAIIGDSNSDLKLIFKKNG